MKQAVRKSNDRQRAAAAGIAARRKQLAMVFGLFFVMAVLWVKLFVGKAKPKTAMAIPVVNAVETTARSAAAKVIYTESPVIAAGHDVLANDLFSAQNFRGFRKQGETAADSEVNMTSEPNRQLSGDLAAAAEELELLTIVNDKRPQAFIEDGLFEKGQSFRFMFHDQTYVFKVVNILENGVELECNGVTITKKIPGLLFETE